MAENKTQATNASVDAFLDSIAPERRDDARALTALMSRATGQPPVMWGPAIVGFGGYHYRYHSGREGDACRVGFSPRQAALTLYLAAAHPARDALLARLGKHTTKGGCVYVKRLADVDATVLAELVAASFAANREHYPEESRKAHSASNI